MNAICLAIDRLHAAYLGCYGNGWIATPAVDRLAGGGFLWDCALIDSPAPEHVCRSFWTGQHAVAHDECPSATNATLLDGLHAAGVATTLLADDPRISRHPLAEAFGQRIELPRSDATQSAVTMEETATARSFAEALDWLDGRRRSSSREPFFLWWHLGAMAGAWDAPTAMRERFRAENDPPAAEFINPPHQQLSEETDPDEVLAVRHAYAAQVELLDHCVEAFLDWFLASPLAADTLFCLTSIRGIPLGVHGVIGEPSDVAAPLHSELNQMAWLMRLPNGEGAADRSGALVQPADLPATLLEWWQIPVPFDNSFHGRGLLGVLRGEADAVRDRASIIAPDGQRGLRTPAWYARFPVDGKAELYRKPDDRWETNDVADRCGEIIEQMRAALEAKDRAMTSSDTMDLEPLDEALVE